MKGRLGFVVVIIGALLLNFSFGLPQLVGVGIFLGGLLRPVLEPVVKRLRGLATTRKENEEQARTIAAILSGIWTELDSLNTLVGAMVVLNFVAVIAMIILGAIVVGSLWQ